MHLRRFATGKGVQSLMNILKAYAALDPEVGYCQGMNFLAGVLLMYLPSEADAYGALVVLMRQRGLRELYKTDLAWLQVGGLPSRHSLDHAHAPLSVSRTPRAIAMVETQGIPLPVHLGSQAITGQLQWQCVPC